MKTIKYFALLCVFGAVAWLTSCTKTTGDAYKKYEAGGEITYPGRADSVLVRSGYNRVQLAVVLGNDPLVTKIRIYWNNLLDSIDVAVTRTAGKDTATVIIPNLTEGNYNFVVYTYDSQNHKSVVSNASGVVYGPSYLASLTNRTLKSLTQSTDGNKIELAWGEPAGGELGIEVNYTGLNGVVRKIIVSPNEVNTELPDYKESTQLTYKSLYKPDSSAFETFSPAASSVTLPKFERQMLKSNFKIVILPTDVLEGGYGWLENFLWDENYNPPGFATRNQIPCWFTMDMGASASISRFKMWQANDRLYDQQNVKTFEVWGSNNPNPDGSYDSSWTKLTSCTSIKPSGAPLGTVTATDVAYAKAGEEFVLPAGSPKVRYIRIKCLTNWGNGSFMAMEELTFYTHDK
ncbi:protein of unknown function [Mucilaginibacter pineti]|uniref:F5/8 type C domain-containing protein n=1 Tax=Mucilaginibacter pineti TaxID=1391627 RepID=A0A1G7LYH3_9SPHI|nr:DUF4998 domain-containing protein [Mucilaginibacter pineti]SDF54618.1 protein of unknown function [Mucilaginibacter pineti]